MRGDALQLMEHNGNLWLDLWRSAD